MYYTKCFMFGCVWTYKREKTRVIDHLNRSDFGSPVSNTICALEFIL